MVKHTTVKKSLILLVAVLMCVAVFLSACSDKPFTPNFTAPTGGQVTSNGGIAVKYGDYIYYVNGYQSDASADNSYINTNDDPRVGSVVRIKAEDIAGILAINDEDLSNSEKLEAIADAVREKVQVVVPKIYYSANTTTAGLNGIYIFNDRLFMLTPNDQLTAGGNSQTDQSVLMSFDLNGANPVRHFTFTGNNAQVWLYQNGDGVVMATYLLKDELHVLKLGAAEKDTVDTLIADDEDEAKVSSVNFDLTSESVFFLDNNGSICRLACGATEKEVIVNNATGEDEDDSTFAYSISNVSNGFVYFTRTNSDNSSVDSTVLYYASSSHKVTEVGGEPAVACNTTDLDDDWQGWKENKLVAVKATNGYYGLYIISSVDGSEQVQVLQPGFNEQAITINKIEGDTLYYTANSVTYTKDLSVFENGDEETIAKEVQSLGTPYAASWSNTSATGWGLPDIVVVGEHTYMFTFGTGTVSVVEFKVEDKTNSTSAAMTLKAAKED